MPAIDKLSAGRTKSRSPMWTRTLSDSLQLVLFLIDLLLGLDLHIFVKTHTFSQINNINDITLPLPRNMNAGNKV